MSAPVGPCDGTCIGVDHHARKVLWVLQRLEHTSPLASREIDLADRSIIEGKAHPVFPADLHPDYVVQLLYAKHVTPAPRSALAEANY